MDTINPVAYIFSVQTVNAVLSILSVRKNAASCPTQNPSRLPDLCIYVEFMPLYYGNTLL